LDRSIRFTLSLLTFVVIAGPRLVHAEASPSPPQAASGGASAIEELQRGYQTTGNPEFLFKLAETYRETGNATAAARTYEAYLRRAPRGPHRAAAEKQLRALDTAAESGPSTPSAAPPSPVKPAPSPVKPASPADTPLPPSEPAPPPRSVPQARDVPSTSHDHAEETPAGVALSAPSAPAAASPPLPAWLPWAAAGSTLALGAGAIVFGTMASSKYDQLHGSCAQTSAGCTTAQIDEVRSRAGTANILWIATAVTAAVTGVTIFINTREAGASALWRF